MRRQQISASAPTLPPLAPQAADATAPLQHEIEEASVWESTHQESSRVEEWDKAAEARRMIGAKPRRRRKHRDDAVLLGPRTDDVSYDDEGFGRRKSRSVSALCCSIMSRTRGLARRRRPKPENQDVIEPQDVPVPEDVIIPEDVPPMPISDGPEQVEMQPQEEEITQLEAAAEEASTEGQTPSLPSNASAFVGYDPGWEGWVDLANEVHSAVHINDISSVRRLLARAARIGPGFPIDNVGPKGETAAITAAKAGYAEVCAVLLDGRANPLARDTNPEFFNDAIWPDESRAAGVRRARVPPSVQSQPGRTVVYHLRLTRSLDEVVAKIFPLTRIALVKTIAGALEAFHQSPAVVIAAKRGNCQLLALLLTNAMATPAALTGNSIQSGPARAFWSDHKAGVPNLNERASALLVACTSRHWQCVEVLLAAGVTDSSVDRTRDPSGRTVLHLAAAAGDVKTVRLLLRSGASTTARSYFGRQPLHDAAVVGHVAVAQALVDKGADPLDKVQDCKPSFPCKMSEVGKNAVQLAEEHCHRQLCMYLQGCHVDRGAPRAKAGFVTV